MLPQPPVPEPPPFAESALVAEESEERALLARLRAGDERAYETLVRTQGARMLAVARRYAANDVEAQEAVQDAFVSAFRALPGFQGASRLSTWLHRITVNAALMRARGQARRREQDLDELLPKFSRGGHFVDDPVAWHATTESDLERGETRALVRSAIDELPENYRTVLVLRDIEEWEVAAIAEHLCITPNAVKVRVHRARQALRTLLDPHFREGGA